MSAQKASGVGPPDNVLLTGFLWKRGHFVKSWRKRYFVLRTNSLSYSVSEGSNEKGSFSLTKNTKLKESSMEKFCFELMDEKRELLLIAEDEAEMTEWMEMIQEALSAQSFIHSAVSKSIGSVKLNRLFPRQQTQNTLTVQLARARGLSAKNKNSTSNPYAIITVGSDKARSSTIDSQLNPTWNETFNFSFDRSFRYARVEIWDEDSGVGKDRFLGLAMIPIYMLPCNVPQANWFGLGKRSSRSRVSGEVFVEVSCNVEIELMAIHMFKDVCRLPELSMLPFLNNPGIINRNPNFKDVMHYFPGEILEDLSMHVILKTELGGECFYSNGILMLSNYRLIFVGASRINALRQCYGDIDEDRGDISMYVPIGAIIQVSMGEEPDYLNPSLSIETIRLKTCDARVLTLLFRDTAFIGEGSIISTSGLSVDHVTGPKSRSIPSNPTTRDETSRLLSDDDEFNVPPLAAMPSDKRASTNPALAASMMEQIRKLFKSLSSSDENGSSERANPQQRTISSATVSMKDVLLMGEDIEDDVHYLEACESAEGPPSQRVFACLNYRVLNRHLETRCASHLFRTVVNNESIYLSVSETDPLSGEPTTNSVADEDETVANRFDLSRGWSLYDPVAHFGRMAIPDAYWKLSTSNSHTYAVSDTYPGVVAIPCAVDDTLLKGSAHFRSRNRFPALSWRHPRNKTSLTRCSQPLVGIGQKRSAEDEIMLQLVNAARGIEAAISTQRSCSTSNSENIQVSRKGSYEHKRPLMIMDARPKINAQANQAAGKGFESPKVYGNMQINFLEIANIHAVRSSLESLEELCCNDAGSEGAWLKNVDTTGWLLHIRKILSGAARIAHCMDREELSVLVHCSDGWDRTAQLTSLTMLMLDEHYRTLFGFMELLEKEWFSFGHKFMDRLGFSLEGWSSDDRSPVFQQFLDCVFQCMSQMPDVFEFNEALLIFILQSLQSGLFGNVYSNCEKERNSHHHSMMSIWSVVLANQGAFTNPAYRKVHSACVPVTSAKRLLIWNNWFLSWHDMIWSHIWSGRMEDLGAADESFVESLMPPMSWMDNSAAKSCGDSSCNRPFTIYRRRHHCRACGLIFCERCSSHRRIVTSVSSSTLSRTCRNCAIEIDMANRFKSRAIGVRPKAVGNSRSNRFKFRRPLLVLSDESEDDVSLFSLADRQEGFRSIARKIEHHNSGEIISRSGRSRSFSEVPI